MQKSIKKRLKNEQTPLIDGNKVTFVWKGDEAPNLVGDLTGWDGGEPVVLELAEPGIWAYQQSFPQDAYIEYDFQLGDIHYIDPLNSRKISNGMGGMNSYFSMPGHTPTKLIKRNKKVPQGVVTSYHVPTNTIIIGEKRRVHLYQPPTQTPAPLMVVWDGQDYLKRMHLNIIVDNLIAQKRIEPLALAFVNNGGQKARIVEYGCSEASLYFLMSEVLPLAIKNLNLIDIHKNPGAYGVVGASMGGLMALYTGLRLPQVFGHVLSQSGAFTTPVFESVVFDLLKSDTRRKLEIWMDVGMYDLVGLLDVNRRMNENLKREGYEFYYQEYHAGHNYPAWAEEIGQGLEYLFGTV